MSKAIVVLTKDEIIEHLNTVYKLHPTNKEIEMVMDDLSDWIDETLIDRLWDYILDRLQDYRRK